MLPRSWDGDRSRPSVGGVDLIELAAACGTPVFVVDEAHLEDRLTSFRRAFGDETVLVYAGKAFLCGALVRMLIEHGWWLDAVSAGELGIALRAGMNGSRILLHGNAKPRSEVETARRAGIARIVVDHPGEIALLSALGGDCVGERDARPAHGAGSAGGASPSEGTRHADDACPRDIAVLLRLNPEVAAVTHEKVKTTGVAAQFGMTPDVAAAVAADVAATPGLTLAGVHIHAGSQIRDLATFRRAAAAAVTFVEPLRPLFHERVDLDLGGGLAVPYVAGDPAPGPDEFAAAVRGGLEDARAAERLGPYRLMVEPGRSVVANAGLTLYRVEARKRMPDGRDVIGVDGGLSDNPRPSLYGQRYEVLPVSRAGEGESIEFRVVGRHCETGDLISPSATLPGETGAGDLVAVPATGAYAHSMSSRYNGLPRPPVVFARDGAHRVAIRRETLDDMISCDMDLAGDASSQSPERRTSTALSSQPSGSNLSSPA